MVKKGVNPEILLGGGYGHKVHVWDLPKRRHLQELDLGSEQQMALELRPAHDPTRGLRFSGRGGFAEGSLGVDLALASRRDGKWAIRKVIEIPAEPADPALLPPLLQGFKAVPPLVTDINLSLDDRFLYVSCFGTGEFLQYDVSDPFHPRKTGSVHLGGIVRKAAHPKQSEDATERRAADGGNQPRRQAHLLHEFSLHAVGRAVLSGRHPGLDGEAGREAGRRHAGGPEVLRGVRRAAAHQVRLEGGDASSDSYCYV